MKLFNLFIGEEGIHYDRRTGLDTCDCEMVRIVAKDYDEAKMIAIKYLNKNYDDVEYELYEVDYSGVIEEPIYINEEY